MQNLEITYLSSKKLHIIRLNEHTFKELLNDMITSRLNDIVFSKSDMVSEK